MEQEILTEGEGLSTVNLLIKIACFVKKEKYLFSVDK
jgi:hypothetical protein